MFNLGLNLSNLKFIENLLTLTLMKTLLLSLLTILTLGFQTPKKETIFIGKVTIDSDIKDNIYGLLIEFRVDTIAIARYTFQQEGNFKIAVNADKAFEIFYRGPGISDTYVQTIKPTDNDTVLLNIKIPRDYKKHLGKIICPKCSKHDKTIPIIYGLKAIAVYEKNQPDYTTYIGSGKQEIFDGGCVTSEIDAQFFCKRDGIRF